MPTIDVYEPPQSCATGACAPDAVDAAARFDDYLPQLTASGIVVNRYNLGLDPEAFATNALVRRTLKEEGMSCLPLIVADGMVVSKGRFPSRDELLAHVEASQTPRG